MSDAANCRPLKASRGRAAAQATANEGRGQGAAHAGGGGGSRTRGGGAERGQRHRGPPRDVARVVDVAGGKGAGSRAGRGRARVGARERQGISPLPPQGWGRGGAPPASSTEPTGGWGPQQVGPLRLRRGPLVMAGRRRGRLTPSLPSPAAAAPRKPKQPAGEQRSLGRLGLEAPPLQLAAGLQERPWAGWDTRWVGTQEQGGWT
jgi:hypothetical protein